MIIDGKTLDPRNPEEIRQRLGVVAGTDARLTDARLPVSHTHRLADIQDYAAIALPQALRELDDHLIVTTTGELVVQADGTPVFCNLDNV